MYSHRDIEAKWQRFWEDNSLFKAEVDATRPKYYILDMFPYPSGEGLHVGHVTGYTATDVVARYRRMKGYNVLHPMGWDSFGLPAEQYAIRTGTHPAETTERNIQTYRRQLRALGLSYDWSRELRTSDPAYYKWTQWIFTELYKRGLAYQAEILVNYCPALRTVLANEEVDHGVSKDGGHPIERRPLKQWVLKITAYADRLVNDLDLVDWPESVKTLQRNWVGKREGATLTFPIEGHPEHQIAVFTTRPDTLWGVSFLVLAPEHPLVDRITTPEQRHAVAAYRQEVAAKSDFERTEVAKDKTGVWTGAYAYRPGSEERIPLWIADYVLPGYGTGAVMGVPSHDERDWEFAHRFRLPLLPVVIPEEASSAQEVLEGRLCWTGGGVMRASGSATGLTSDQAKHHVVAWLQEHGYGKASVSYKLRDWLFSRQRYWGEPFPILHFSDGTSRVLELDELPLTPPTLHDYQPSPTGESPLSKVTAWVEVQDPKTGRRAFRETHTMPQWAGSCWYYLRFCDPHNERQAWDREKEAYWMPVDLYVGGVEHAVLHLLYARFWHKVLYDCGYVSTPEPFQQLRNQGLLTARSYKLPLGGYLRPEEVEQRGEQYVQKGTGTLLVSSVEKMSKSKLNGVTPDQMIEEYGADTLRLYELFMGPFEQEKVWTPEAVHGCHRFLSRFYQLIVSPKVSDAVDPEGMKLAKKVVYDVERGIESLSFNTAIAKLMEFVNHFTPLPVYPKEALVMVVQALSPFAPHLAEEAWELLGRRDHLAYAPFPSVDPQDWVEDEVTYVVQVNGKVRGKCLMPREASQEEVCRQAENDPALAKYLQGGVRHTVFVPNRLINFVV